MVGPIFSKHVVCLFFTMQKSYVPSSVASESDPNSVKSLASVEETFVPEPPVDDRGPPTALHGQQQIEDETDMVDYGLERARDRDADAEDSEESKELTEDVSKKRVTPPSAKTINPKRRSTKSPIKAAAVVDVPAAFASTSTGKSGRKTPALASKPVTSRRRTSPNKRLRRTVLPFTYTKENFQHFCRCRVSQPTLRVVHELAENYFQRTIDQVVTCFRQGRGKTITPKHVIKVLKAQRIITDDEPLEVLVRRFFPLEYRRLLLPCAIADNKVEP